MNSPRFIDPSQRRYFRCGVGIALILGLVTLAACKQPQGLRSRDEIGPVTLRTDSAAAVGSAIRCGALLVRVASGGARARFDLPV
jgi:hypothetical protein